MVFKKIISQKRYVELETPPPFMEKPILNFHFDYLNPSLRGEIGDSKSCMKIDFFLCKIRFEHMLS